MRSESEFRAFYTSIYKQPSINTSLFTLNQNIDIEYKGNQVVSFTIVSLSIKSFFSKIL